MIRTAYLLLSTAVLTATAGFGTQAARAPLSSSIAATAPSAAAEIVRLARARDGMFYLTLDVNGEPVRFLVDTGASVVVFREADAVRAGVTADRGQIDSMRTAGGQQVIRWGSADRMTLTHRDFGPIDVAIADTGMPTSLLGQNFLSRLGSVTIQGDTMTVTAKGPGLADPG